MNEFKIQVKWFFNLPKHGPEKIPYTKFPEFFLYSRKRK